MLCYEVRKQAIIKNLVISDKQRLKRFKKDNNSIFKFSFSYEEVK